MTQGHAIGLLYREQWGHVLATLIRVLGEFDLAEEAAQEAFAAALEQWPERGTPANATAWLIQTGRHKGHRHPPTTREFAAQDRGAGYLTAHRGGPGGGRRAAR